MPPHPVAGTKDGGCLQRALLKASIPEAEQIYQRNTHSLAPYQAVIMESMSLSHCWARELGWANQITHMHSPPFQYMYRDILRRDLPYHPGDIQPFPQGPNLVVCRTNDGSGLPGEGRFVSLSAEVVKRPLTYMHDLTAV